MRHNSMRPMLTLAVSVSTDCVTVYRSYGYIKGREKRIADRLALVFSILGLQRHRIRQLGP
jgi:hypothetical protein